MDALARHVAMSGPFLRRRDILAAGYCDDDIAAAIEAQELFRVRHGWYARTGTPEIAVRAVRVGGRVTGVSALRARGLFLPQPAKTEIVVPANAAGLRRPRNRFERLAEWDDVTPLWEDRPRHELDPASWIVSEEEALACVLRRQSREVAVAACDGMIRYLGWTADRLGRAFETAPARVKPWLSLVDGRADSWGESFVRLWLGDVGIPFEPQPVVPGVGRLDGRVSEHVYIEIDGAQHGEDWAGEGPSSFESDHRRDTMLAEWGCRVLRWTTTQLVEDWPHCLAAVRRARADDLRFTRLVAEEDQRRTRSA